jgi:hypothetical protein
MIIKDLKADLTEAAQNKLKAMIAEAVENKVQKEIGKFNRKLTVKLLVTGVAIAGAYLLINYSDKIVDLVV